MTAPSVSARDILIAKGVTASFPAYIGRIPATPDNVILISDTGGQSSEAKWLMDYPTISIVVRAVDYPTGYAKAKEIKDALHSIPSQTINGDRWVSCLITGDINYLGMSDKDRPSFSLNFRLIIEPANTSADSREPL